jgi:hypothetical protein
MKNLLAYRLVGILFCSLLFFSKVNAHDHGEYHNDWHQWHDGHHHERVYVSDPWYDAHNVYIYNGSAYPYYYAGYPYYYYNPHFYYVQPAPTAQVNAVNVELNLGS